MNTLEIKESVRQRDGYCCTDCGVTNDEYIDMYGRALDVHRKIPGTRYSIDGCITLCRACHGKKPKGKPGESLSRYVCLPLLHRHLLNQLCQETHRQITTEIQLALETHFAKAGLWPPSPETVELIKKMIPPRQPTGRPRKPAPAP